MVNKVLELWMITLATGKAEKVTDKPIHDILVGYNWLSDESALTYAVVPQSRDKPLSEKAVPTGPIVEENLGKKAPNRTYQDLLKSPTDEAFFEYYLTAEILIKPINGTERSLLPKAIYSSMNSSPGAKEIMVSSIKKPYSYLVPYSRFPKEIYIISTEGQKIKTLAEIPLLDNIPNGFNAVEKGPRRFSWRADEPQTVYYFEALDEGDPKVEASKRDALYLWKSPYTQAPVRIAELPLRAGGIIWGNAQTALLSESWWTDRKTRTYLIDPLGKNQPKVIFDRSSEDRYNDPGSPLTTSNANGFNTLALSAKMRCGLLAQVPLKRVTIPLLIL